jgi:hypothetical protein
VVNSYPYGVGNWPLFEENTVSYGVSGFGPTRLLRLVVIPSDRLFSILILFGTVGVEARAFRILG